METNIKNLTKIEIRQQQVKACLFAVAQTTVVAMTPMGAKIEFLDYS